MVGEAQMVMIRGNAKPVLPMTLEIRIEDHPLNVLMLKTKITYPRLLPEESPQEIPLRMNSA